MLPLLPHFPDLLHIIYCSLALSPPNIWGAFLLDSFFLACFSLIILWIISYCSHPLKNSLFLYSNSTFNSFELTQSSISWIFFSWYPPMILHWSIILIIILNLNYRLELQTSISNIPSWYHGSTPISIWSLNSVIISPSCYPKTVPCTTYFWVASSSSSSELEI